MIEKDQTSSSLVEDPVRGALTSERYNILCEMRSGAHRSISYELPTALSEVDQVLQDEFVVQESRQK